MSGRSRFFVGGNWKCKGSRKEIAALCEGLSALGGQVPQDVEVVLFPSMLHLDLVSRSLSAPFAVGAQDCWGPKVGDFTGSVSASMLVDFGVGWVLLGHSDRRNTIGETPELIGSKASAALAAGLNVNMTVGETGAQRAAGEVMASLEAQLSPVADAIAQEGALKGDVCAAWARVVLAYEPVWAIGEGATPCTPEQAQEVHGGVRRWLSQRVSPEAAEQVRIVYTGSVSPANCAAFAKQADIDGFVCGRASLVPDDFLVVARCKEV